jgi:acyl-coenzyme A synthetase/AMP-(fatty) acid ligase/acyl carrier protein
MYTSGSSGQPKGVVQDHRGVLHKAMMYTNNLRVCLDDRLTLLHSFSFGACTHHLFGSLLSGASLFPFDARLGAGRRLAKWLITEQVTIYHSVPTAFRQMIGALTGEEEFPNLRVINLSGAPMTKEDVTLYQRHFSSDCILIHMMGATETGYIGGYFISRETQINGGRVPVGYAAEGKEVILLGDDGREIGYEQIGEIAVRSRYLSPGYWRKPKLTRAKFTPDPEGGDKPIYLTGDHGFMHPDGCLVHLGRKDFQVKIRGHRIEVSEIEMALTDLDAVKEAIVVARDGRAGDQQLVAYLVAAGQPAPAISELRNFLKTKLPDYMIPSIFVMLGALPLTANGKVDRLALPAPGSVRPELQTPFVSPRTPLEEELAGIWAEVLGLDQVGIHDSFLDLGGDSLLATQIISRVINAFGVELPVKSLLQAPSVAEMALLIMQSQAKKAGEEDLNRMLAGLEALSDEEAQRLLDKKDKEDQQPNKL